MKKLFSMLPIAVFLFVVQGIAQPAAWSRLGAGARGMGAANAGSSIVEDGNYSLYNPALASFTTVPGAEASSGMLPFGVRWNLLQGQFLVPPKAALTVGLMHSGVRGIDSRSPSGYPEGDLETNEFMLFGSFGLAFSEKVRGGITFKFFRSALHEDVPAANTTAVDIGIVARPSAKWTLGVSIHDLLGSFKWDTKAYYGEETSANRINELPRTVKASLSYLLSPSQTLTTEVQRSYITGNAFRINNPEFPGSFSTVSEHETQATQTSVRLAYRHRFGDRFGVRGGFEADPNLVSSTRFSAGATIQLPYDTYKPAIDYALLKPAYGIGFIHILSLRMTWDRKK